MENISLVSYGEDCSSYNDEYYEMIKVIESDFKKFINYILVDYKNNEDLINECNFLLKNIHNVRPYDDSYENSIDLTNNFLSFDYPVLDKHNGIELYNSNIVIVRRNYKEFYFIYPEKDSSTMMIKQYKLEDKYVKKKIYNNMSDFYSHSDDAIEESIKKLELSLNM